MLKEEIQKYTIITVLIIIAYLIFLLIEPFLIALVTGAILAYIFYPIQRKLREKLNPTVSGILVTTLAIIVILLPLGIAANMILKEAIKLYQLDAAGQLRNWIIQIIGNAPQVTNIIDSAIKESASFIADEATRAVIAVPSKIVDIMIVVGAMFYLLIHGGSMLRKTFKIISLEKKEKFVEHLGKTINSIVYGLVITAIVETIIASVGFWILGIDTPVILGLLVGVFALIPILGPGMIWIPLVILAIGKGEISIAIALMVLGVILTLIETLGKAKLIEKGTKMHPLVILIGIIGGVKLFGAIGLVVGPVLLSLGTVVIEEYFPETRTV